MNHMFLFDNRDHELLKIVNEVFNKQPYHEFTKSVFYEYFHPLGIMEMAESRGLNLAYCVAYLLHSLEGEKVNDRLKALRSLRDEVLSFGTTLQINTARVLLQIMKEIIKAYGDHVKQFELAHDFRVATSGKPRIIRKKLKQYQLIEMPEEWNQVSFDDHVHDAGTKGRKTPTHLIMDAWIKGIKRLRVVYYNYIQPKFAAELIEAANIMNIKVRIGVEYSARFRNRYITITWVPRGFKDTQSFFCFLADNSVSSFMEHGKKVSIYKQNYVMQLLDEYNNKHRHDIAKKYSINLDPVEDHEFLSFVREGEASIVHLAEFLHKKIIYSAKLSVNELRNNNSDENSENLNNADELIKEINLLDPETIRINYLTPEKNPEIIDVESINDNDPQLPSLLKLSAYEILSYITNLRSSYRITLNISKLKVEDVIEILYDCEGVITRIEIFNLKDYASGNTSHIAEINELQQAINSGSVIKLKKIINQIIIKVQNSQYPDKENRLLKLHTILHDIDTFRSMYKGRVLKARIGSDSTSRTSRMYGMGFAIIDSLTNRVRNNIQRNSNKIIPIRITPYYRKTYKLVTERSEFENKILKLINKVTFLKFLFYKCEKDWFVEDIAEIDKTGNILILGGVQKNYSNNINIEPEKTNETNLKFSWKYLRTTYKNIIKVVLGFIPAFLTFILTNDWWLLAYFGAFIWFGITGIRNIIQSVLGGGGFRRSPLLRWNDYVSWDRITDSLLYTGFSVPLLDLIVKTLILDNCFNITTSSSPVLLYTIMAISNGIYLSSHNAFRGLPKGAIFGNFFRSVASIPIAIIFNYIAGNIFFVVGLKEADFLQKSAAIISKAASDCVAGIIEGTADRYENIKRRRRDYKTMLNQLFNAYSQLEIMFPDIQTLEILNSPKTIVKSNNVEAIDQGKIIIITSLDLLYFWMYQPRARSVLKSIIQKLSPEEKEILIKTQSILLWQRQISQLFINGFVGRKFSKALAFYLNRCEEYINALKKFHNL